MAWAFALSLTQLEARGTTVSAYLGRRGDERLNRLYRELGIAAIVVSLLLTIVYGTYLYRNKNAFLGVGEARSTHGPNAFFMDERIHHGELPLWDPLIFCGMPFAGDPASLLLYPPNIVRSLLTSDPTPYKSHVGLSILVVLHLLVAGTGAFYLARRHGLSYTACMVAAMGFTFGPDIMRASVRHWNILFLVSWTPWILVFLHCAGNSRGVTRKFAYAAATGLALSLQIGIVQHYIYVCILSYTYIIVLRLLELRVGAAGPLRSRLGVLSGDVATVSIAVLLSLAFSASSVLPTKELADRSARAADSKLKWAEIERERPPVASVVSNLITYPGDPNIMGIRGLGAGLLILAIAGFSNRRWREAVLFGSLYYAMLDIALRPPFPIATFVEWASPVRLSGPERALTVGSLPLAILAGFGADALGSPRYGTLAKAWSSVFMLAAGLVVVVVLAYSAPSSSFAPNVLWAVSFPACVAALAVLLPWLRRPKYWSVLLPALIVLEVAYWVHLVLPQELGRTGALSVPRNFRESKTFWSDNGRGAYGYNENMYDLQASMTGSHPIFIEAVRQALCHPFQEENYERGIPSDAPTRGHLRGNLFAKRQFWLASQYVAGPLPGKYAAFPPTTTTFISTGETFQAPGVDAALRKQRPSSEEASSRTQFDAAQELLPVPRVDARDVGKMPYSENTSLRSLVDSWGLPVLVEAAPESESAATYTFPTIEIPAKHSTLEVTVSTNSAAYINVVFTDSESGRSEYGIAQELTGPNENFRYWVPLPELRSIETTFSIDFREEQGSAVLSDARIVTDESDENELIQISHRTANAVELKVGPLDGYRILTNISPYFPGWRAYVDSKPVPMLKAMDAFTAIVLPPGTHVVRFVYSPRSFYLGLAISFATLGMVVLLLVHSWNRQRRIRH